MALSKITTESLLDGEITAAKFATGVGGKVVQVVNVMDGAVGTGTTIMPADDTIPQNSEGDELFTLAITPTNSSNKLIIQAVVSMGASLATHCTIALFQDSTAGAIAVVSDYHTAGNSHCEHSLTHYMTAGTTSSTTFKIRGGGSNAGTYTFNGASASRHFGGVIASSITITEISA